MQLWYFSFYPHDAVIELRLRSHGGIALRCDHPQLDHHLAAPPPVHHRHQLSTVSMNVEFGDGENTHVYSLLALLPQVGRA